MITTIIFDLSEVFMYGMKGIERKIEKITGMTIEQELRLEKEAEKLFHGQITEDAFWQSLIERKIWRTDIHTLKQLVRSQMIEIEGTREIIERLKEKGYRLGLLSIHAKEWVEHCEEQFNYHKLFDSVMYSFEVGVCKPEPKAFRLILRKLQVSPQECLFIDDSLTNIESARKLGIKTIHFQDASQLKEALKELQIS